MQNFIRHLAIIVFSIFFVISKLLSQNLEAHSQLTIVSEFGQHVFNVEVVRTPSKRSKGLQGRLSLGIKEGMLFSFKKDQIVRMWMKDTILPLDMIFILPNGIISEIFPNNTPYSENIISSSTNIKAVLEISAGLTEKLKITPGDIIKHKLFKNK